VVVDGGKLLHLSCMVANGGPAAAEGVRVTLSIPGSPPTTTPPASIAPEAAAPFDVSIRIPTSVKPDERLPVRVEARETSLGASHAIELTAVVRMPTVCPDGKLTRTQYEKKRVELKAALDAGALSAEEHDRYDAELVSCLE
jgi:hypothetical protein